MNEIILSHIQKVKQNENPNIKSMYINMLICDMLREKEISLYEAYLLEWERLKQERVGYLTAWGGRVQISTCLEILNQRYLALAFDDSDATDILLKWGMEAYKYNAEKRKHYIQDNYVAYLELSDNREALLEDLRQSRKKKGSFNRGPYLSEVFPYTFYEPENLLLNHDPITQNKEVHEDISFILQEITEED